MPPKRSKNHARRRLVVDLDARAWHEVDVTAALAADGRDADVFSFCVMSDAANVVAFASRERYAGSLSPELVLTLSSVLPVSAHLYHRGYP